MWRLETVVQLAAACIVGAFLLVLTPPAANAQSACVTKYTGCEYCDNIYKSVWWCWTNESSPQPYANAGWGTCQARFALPGYTTCEPSQPADPNQRNVYRFNVSSQTDHFLTLNWTEGNSVGQYERIAFTAYVSPLDANMHVLYRCRVSAQDHFVSADANCEGRINEGSYGYVSTTARAGFVPLHRFYNNAATDHLSTKDYNEGVAWGAAYEGIQGYVPN